MLTIKRVPTVLSNHQEEDSENQGCGRKCLADCCLSVSKLPLYAVGEGGVNNNVVICPGGENHPPFLALLLGEWEDRMKQGLFRYDVTTCETKVLPGKCGFIAQLNEGRHLKKRPSEFSVDRVLQPFDKNKFNFRKVGQEEVVFRFERSNEKMSCYIPWSQALPGSGPPSIVAINVSPIEYGHVLLVPRVSECLPQRIDHDSFSLAVQMAKEAGSPFFRVGYNSLGAFATINHLHFQAYYLDLLFPVEKAPTRKITSRNGTRDNRVIVSLLLDYPVRCIVYEGGNTTRDLSDAVASSCMFLQNNNIPFNVLIADEGRRIFLFPQCYAKKQALGEVTPDLLETQVNPAVWEISGHIVLKKRTDFETASQDYTWRLLNEVSLSDEAFKEVQANVLEAAGFHEAIMDNIKLKEQAPLKTPSRTTRHLPQGCQVHR